MDSAPRARASRRADGPAVHRRLETEAARRLGLEAETLMERAGESARRLLRRRWPWARTLLVLCGTGNNGGDGYVLARRVLETGGEAIVLAWGEAASAPARAARARYAAAGGRIVPRAECRAFLASWPSWPETVLADGLFGIGLTRPLERETADLLLALAASTREILALDIPSGLDAATGQPRPVALPARETLAFLTAAPGHFTASAARYVGRLEVDPLGLEGLLSETAPEVVVPRLSDLETLLPPRPPDAHKGLGGHVLVAGGDLGYGGAVRLAGEAALRAGAGLVSVVTRPEHVTGLLAGCSSLMVHGLRRPTRAALARIPASVLAVGPGLGRAPWGHALWALLVRDPRPLVLDADGLNILAAESVRRRDWILTPHPGEAARLLGASAEEVQNDRLAAARELAARHAAVVILKGSGTVVAEPEGALALVPYALPALATAGSGDLLTGIVAGLRARGLGAGEAARAGALLHIRVGLRAARGRDWGLVSQDLLPHIGP
jgi:NAD(P)H-hydrate epimerase